MYKLAFKQSVIAAAISLLFMQAGFAAQSNGSNQSIEATSVQWNDNAGIEKLLAQVPAWSERDFQDMYDAYKNPERFQLPRPSTQLRYNVQFINAFWGPLDNPFTRLPRPSKAFIFINDSNHSVDKFYMAPVVKVSSDNNYYVFDYNQSKRILLKEWVNEIKQLHGQNNLRFNICNAYGDLPADSCSGKSFTEETKDSLGYDNAKFSANENIPSASRNKNENWQLKLNHNYTEKGNGVIYSDSVNWSDIDARNKLLNTVVAWPNSKVIQENFEKLRNIRYFNDSNYVDFKRRISWLYPDDGCWTRASAVNKDLFGPFNNINNNWPRPSKVFAFGNLCVNTPNNSAGYVSWWYHTAPIIRDAETNKTYVLDPSVSPKKPIAMEDWVSVISSSSGACEGSNSYVETFNVCNGYGASPYDQCGSGYLSELKTELLQPSYQSYERYRQVELGRDANAVLGDMPPWNDQ